MSICRRVETGGVYIYEMCYGAKPFHCQICNVRGGGDWFGRTRLSVLWHAFEHKLREGRRVSIRPILSRLLAR